MESSPSIELYDVFVTSKSIDYDIAGEIHQFLQASGLKVFFCNETPRGTANFNRVINEAIAHSRHMVAVASQPEHLESTFVQAEWEMFQTLQRTGGKPGGNLIVVTAPNGHFDIKALPAGLRVNDVFKWSVEDRSRILDKLKTPQISSPQMPHGGSRLTFPQSDSTAFVDHVLPRLQRARNVVLIGTGLNVLQRDPVYVMLLDRACSGTCHLEVYLANPDAQGVEMRLVEEERGTFSPPVGRTGLILRLNSLMTTWIQRGRPKGLSLRLFNHYPTFALLIVDSEYYLYPYGYAQLGNFSPVFHFSSTDMANAEIVAFLDGHYRRVKEDSEELEPRLNPAAVLTDSLHPFALFIVPPHEHAFYDTGSAVLGMDIRARTPLKSKWSNCAGASPLYGLHLTVCDVLYFLTAAERRAAIEEVRFLCRQVRSFELTGLELRKGFPDPGSISVSAVDPSGTLELLHAELLIRVNRRAYASNYTLRTAPLKRGGSGQRANLMMKRYKAPYVLSQFEPHFTLLSAVPPPKMNETWARLQKQFESIGKESITVQSLAIMARDRAEGPWRIESEVQLA